MAITVAMVKRSAHRGLYKSKAAKGASVEQRRAERFYEHEAKSLSLKALFQGSEAPTLARTAAPCGASFLGPLLPIFHLFLSSNIFLSPDCFGAWLGLLGPFGPRGGRLGHVWYSSRLLST